MVDDVHIVFLRTSEYDLGIFVPLSFLGRLAAEGADLVLEYLDVTVQGPLWPWGLSPGVETSEGLELALECVELVSEFAGLALECVELVSEGVEYVEMDFRENFTHLVSPPHLKDPLLVFVFVTTSATNVGVQDLVDSVAEYLDVVRV